MAQPSSNAAAPEVSFRLAASVVQDAATNRLPTAVPIEEVNAQLAPLEPGLSSQQTLERALAYVSALFNAQLARDLLSDEADANGGSTSSSAAIVLVGLVAFCLGVFLTLGALWCYVASKRGASASPAQVIRVGKNQLNIVIEASEGGVTGTQHHVKPPEGQPPAILGFAAPTPPPVKSSTKMPRKPQRASCEPLSGRLSVASLDLTEDSRVA